ncbi:hypothetical protein DEA8626_02045 [Defluviimonas aquaemixtae]|uniref:AAA+ family ATPase n=1 Tax=Albidovulum aquaemixtae TaxID=1542388 RepID=A0A2R8B7B9_9RHOB|nr:AAA+ family ATPase [Defluviimonas aquaemixtae]SPH18506.1 hypothetical protein DEA8626_02045 [Defluviimonas aquaemixtae]
MKRLAAFTIVIATALPPGAGAQDKDTEQGFSLLGEGARIILRSMIDEMEPALKDLRRDFGDAMNEMGPALRDLAAMIGDLRNYHAPEKLPNGDIILRRKTPLEDRLPAPGEEIEI